MDNSWCERALAFSPNLPHLETIKILDYYKGQVQSPLRFWGRMDRMLSHEDTFPRLERVDICISVGLRRLNGAEHQSLVQRLPILHRDGKVYFWGEKGELPSRL